MTENRAFTFSNSKKGTINNSQMDLQRTFRARRSPDDNCCKMIEKMIMIKLKIRKKTLKYIDRLPEV